ncbi:glycosyltransferase [Actinomycetospora termitidis]|uniref:Glycosyltransferase n=1 Tax=Actinomycetospora termitidis TaxID=3053470 RepID=A0ABT7MFV7_9PSEU|nr:glycosyltransferase [Actinomycetospora sp. Odt1-22]MDL5159545.1 glycosyltransferase [Actinomycetospora sp. Odt1-22]
MKLLALPRDPGPFQDGLYGPMAGRHEVRYVSGPTGSHTLNVLLVPVLLVAGRCWGARVLHVHWTFGFVPSWASGRRVARVFRWWFGVCLGLARLLGLRVVWTAHNTLPHAPVFDDDEAARRTLVAACSAIVAPTAVGARELERFGPTCPVHVVPLAALPVPEPVRSVDAVRVAYEVPEGAVLLAFVGKVEPYKGVTDLLDALPALADVPGLPPVVLVVAGECRDASLAAGLRSRVSSAAMLTLDGTEPASSIRLDLRHLDDLELADLLAAADGVVLPFRTVTTSASVLHAMAAGAACLVPDLPAFADVPAGALLRYPPGHTDAERVSALAEALPTLVGGGARLRAAVGSHAALVAGHRDPQRIADHYADLLDALVDGPAAAPTPGGVHGPSPALDAGKGPFLAPGTPAPGTRVALLTPWAPAEDGLARHSADLAATLANTPGVAGIAVVTTSPGPADPTTTRLPALVTPGRIVAAVRARDVDAVHLQFTVPAWGAATPALVTALRRLRRSGTRVVVTLHEVTRELALLGPVARRLYRALADASDAVVVHTPGALEGLAGCGVDLRRVSVLPHGAFGATPHGFLGATRPPRTARERNTVLCFGYLHPDKGLERAIDAIGRVPGARLVVAGAVRPRRGVFRIFGRRDHRYAAELRRRAHDQQVTFTGAVDDPTLDHLLATAAVVVLPYRSATQSGVLNRAVAAGAAVVATDLPGLRADLPPSAITVPAADPDTTPALAAVLSDLLADPARLARLRDDVARTRADHAPERLAAALVDLYQRPPTATAIPEPRPAADPHPAGALR